MHFHSSGTPQEGFPPNFDPFVGYMTREQILSDHPITRGLSAQQIHTLAALAARVDCGQDEVILVTGQQSKAFYLIFAGSVAIELRTPLFSLRVQRLGPGDAFGWSALLEEQDTLFNVRALECCMALRLDGPQLTSACRNRSPTR